MDHTDLMARISGPGGRDVVGAMLERRTTKQAFRIVSAIARRWDNACRPRFSVEFMEPNNLYYTCVVASDAGDHLELMSQYIVDRDAQLSGEYVRWTPHSLQHYRVRNSAELTTAFRAACASTVVKPFHDQAELHGASPGFFNSRDVPGQPDSHWSLLGDDLGFVVDVLDEPDEWNHMAEVEPHMRTFDRVLKLLGLALADTSLELVRTYEVPQ